MTKIVAALVAALLSGLVLVGGASAPAGAVTSAPSVGVTPAAQESRGVVTRGEFRRVRRGMTLPRVHRILGASGKQTSYSSGCCSGMLPASQYREYRTSSRYGFVSLGFERTRGVWRLTDKYAYFG